MRCSWSIAWSQKCLLRQIYTILFETIWSKFAWKKSNFGGIEKETLHEPVTVALTILSGRVCNQNTISGASTGKLGGSKQASKGWTSEQVGSRLGITCWKSSVSPFGWGALLPTLFHIHPGTCISPYSTKSHLMQVFVIFVGMSLIQLRRDSRSFD